MATTVNVRVLAADQNGDVISNASVTAKLTHTDIDPDAGYIMPEELSGVANSDGELIVALWPNELGSTQSQYVFKITNPDNGKTQRITATIPNTDCDLHLVANLPPYPGKVEGQALIDLAVQAVAPAVAAQQAAEQSAEDAAASATTASNAATTASNAATTASDAAASIGSSVTTAQTAATTATTKAGEASASAGAASTSATTANTKATLASTKADEAAISEVNASNSATAAAGSASTASTKASEAAQSATDAGYSAGSASTSATTATDKATIATTKASEAATSAGTAAGHATTASNAASAAEGHATAASGHASAASGSASAASTSASTATTKAGEAAGSALAAAGSASTAATHATTASTKADEAAASALAADASADAAELARQEVEEMLESAAEFGQVNADWNAISGVAEILNKPTIPATAADIGLPNVENKSSEQIRAELTGGDVTEALGFTPLDAAARGAANGVASLNGSGKIPADQLPASATSTDSVSEGTTNKYFTESRVLDTVLAGISFLTSTAVTASDNIKAAIGKLQAQITGLFTFKTIAVAGQSSIVADSNSDTLNLAAGANVTITTDADTDTITISATGGGTSNDEYAEEVAFFYHINFTVY